MNQYQNDYTKINKEKNFCNETLYSEVAEELRVSENFVKEIVKSHSDFIVRSIERGAFESITLPYLGKLKAKLKSVQKADANIKRG
jgi:nucleoid DNA-binding protein